MTINNIRQHMELRLEGKILEGAKISHESVVNNFLIIRFFLIDNSSSG